MKKQIIFGSIATLVVVITALTIVFLQPPVDSILTPYLIEPVVPYQKDAEIQQQVFPTNVPLNNSIISDKVILADDTVISGGQIYTDRGIYAPSLMRTDLSGGVVWITFLNPLYEDGVEYSAYGTGVNQIHDLIYVHDDLVYAVGTIQASILSEDGEDYPLKGVFADQQVPVGLDHLNFIVSFSIHFTNFRFHGFITPTDEAGTQMTVIADVTLLDANTMVLTGVSNSHAGNFEGVSSKDPFDFVMKVNVEDNITLVDVFTFENDAYVQPTVVYALQDGDLVVLGNYQDRSGDFAHIPYVQTVETAGFIARIDGETFTLDWVSSNLMKPITPIAVTMFVNALELTNHHVVTVANVWLANETYEKKILVSHFDTKGTVVKQTLLNLEQKAEAIRLFKATEGYWVAGAVYEGNNGNLILCKLNTSFTVTSIKTILGSNPDLYVTTPIVNDDLDLIFIAKTYSKDEDYEILMNAEADINSMFIKLDTNAIVL